MCKNTHQAINAVYVPLQDFTFRVGCYPELIYHAVQVFYNPWVRKHSAWANQCAREPHAA